MPQPVTHALQSSTLSDVLERVLDKGVVIAGDIKIKLVDIELLSIQIRLVICSVDKAKEMGMDWWVNNPVFCSQASQPQLEASLARIDERLARLEASSAPEAVPAWGPLAACRPVGAEDSNLRPPVPEAGLLTRSAPPPTSPDPHFRPKAPPPPACAGAAGGGEEPPPPPACPRSGLTYPFSTSANIARSTFPPESTAATRLPRNPSRSCRIAATAAAPAPSATLCVSSNTACMAAATWSSFTIATRETCAHITSSALASGAGTAIPSASRVRAGDTTTSRRANDS